RRSFPARACLRGRDSWSARRAAIDQAARKARRQVPPACASRLRMRRQAASAPPRQSQAPREWSRRALPPSARRCRPAGHGFELCDGDRSPFVPPPAVRRAPCPPADRKSTRLNSSHVKISYAVFCLKKKKEV